MANLLAQRLTEEEPSIKNKPKKEKKQKEKKHKKPKEEKIKIAPKTREDIVQENKIADNNYEENLETISADEIKDEEKAFKRSKRKYYFIKIFMCFSCAYLMFLIFGVIMTNYDYNDKGKVVAQRMSIQDIKTQKEYSAILGYYRDSRDLYEKVLLLDYRLGLGEEDPLDLAPEYESLLDECSEIIVQLNALEVSKTYTQTYNLLLTWNKDYISHYLQNMSGAISLNDTTKANEAILDREDSYTVFYQLTLNMTNQGEKVKGVDITDLKQWSPEDYIEEETGQSVNIETATSTGGNDSETESE